MSVGRAPRRPATRLTYVAIAAVAAALRLWGIGFGAGQPRARPDEELYLGPAMKLFDGSLDPHLLWYGFTEGFAFVLHAALRLQAAVLAWRHGVDVHLGCLFALDPTAVLITGRYLSVAFGVATLVPCALVARRLVAPPLGDRAGVVAALLLAVNYLHGRDSHFAVPDAALAWALAAAVASAVRLVDEGRPRAALAAGFFTGLAVAFKWTGLFMLPVLVGAVAVAVVRFRGRQVGWAAALAVAALTFLALDPHVVTEPREALDGLLSHTMRYGEASRGHLQDPSVDPGRGLGFHARVTLPIAFGWCGLAAVVIGIATALRRRPAAACVCVLFLVMLYGVAVGPTRLLFVRYCMPVIPILAALAAVGVVEGAAALAVRLPGGVLRAAVLPIVLAAAALPPAVRLAAADARLAAPDTRTLAAAWLQSAAAGETVLARVAYSAVYGVPAEGLAACRAAVPPALHAAPPILPPFGDPWAPLVAQGRAAWGAVVERAVLDYWTTPGITLAAADLVAVGQPRLACGKPSNLRGVEPPDPACFAEVVRFDPGRAACDAVYDLFDQFYLPYAGFVGIERPGPEVVVYRNRCRRPQDR